MIMEYIIPSLRVAQVTEIADTDMMNERLAACLRRRQIHRKISSESAEGARESLA